MRTSTITNNRTNGKDLRCALSIIHPCSCRKTLVFWGHKICTCVEVEHEEQVTCGASHSASWRQAHKRQTRVIQTDLCLILATSTANVVKTVPACFTGCERRFILEQTEKFLIVLFKFIIFFCWQPPFPCCCLTRLARTTFHPVPHVSRPSTSRCRPWTWRSPVDRWTQRRTQSRAYQKTNSKYEVNLKKNKTCESLISWAAYPDNAV